MKNLLISYTTLIAFVAFSVLAALALPYNTQVSNASTTKASCFKWAFDNTTNFPSGSKVTTFSSPAQGSLTPVKVNVSYRHNTVDYGNNYMFPVKDVRVIRPAANSNTPDLTLPGQPNNQVLILNGGNHNGIYSDPNHIRDAHNGGDMIFDFLGGNITQVKFSTIDMGDEKGEFHGQMRINNNYYIVVTEDGFRHKVQMTKGENIVVDNVIKHHTSIDYGTRVSRLIVHFSGSAALDNLEYCNKTVPTRTPPPPATTVPPTATPTPSVMKCTERKIVKYFNNEMLVAGLGTQRTTLRNDGKSSVPATVSLVGETNYNVQFPSNNTIYKNHPVYVMPKWGWRGDANATYKQTNEAHKLTVRSGNNTIGNANCMDWGNLPKYTDGQAPIASIEANGSVNTNSRYIQKCINNIVKGVPSIPQNGITINGSKIIDHKMTVNAKHATTKAEFDACKAQNNGKAAPCRGSHYSLLEVSYCVKEG